MDMYAHPEYLVETDWVADHLDDPQVRIIESDEDPLLYKMGLGHRHPVWRPSQPANHSH